MRFDINNFDRFIFRTPYLPINQYQGSDQFESIGDFLLSIFSQKAVREAILIASPEFSKEVERFLKNEMDDSDPGKMRPFYYSALKYINRMSSRCTPFGLFAGCGIGEISAETTRIAPLNEGHFKKHIHWDSGFLLSVIEQLTENPRVRPYLKYAKNNTIYTVGNALRYVEYNYNQRGNRVHTLSSFKSNTYLDKINKLVEKATSFQVLAASVVDDDIDFEDAADFINELIDSKYLLSELEPSILGEMYDDQVLALIGEKLQLSLPADVEALLGRVYQLLISIKSEDITQNSLLESYQEILDKTNKQDKKYATRDIFQVDSEIISEAANISQETIRDIKNGMRAFYKLSALSFSNDTLSAFKKKFGAKYEDQLVPLLEALDPEIGLTYGPLSENLLYPVPLVDDLPMIKPIPLNRAETLSWEPDFHGFLLKKIMEALKKGSAVVDLKKADIDRFNFDIGKIPSSMNAFVNLIPNGEDKYLVNFKDWGSDSALTLIGRFTLLGPEFAKLADDIARFEDDCLHENQVLAEINHLADSRTGNIISRSRMRRYEIPYITNPGCDKPGMIKVTDLYIRLEDNEFKIYSKALNVQVIPVLSNAHNFNKNPLPLYKFLCDLQNDAKGGTHYMSLNMGAISRLMDHIPRIQFENYIFRPATWKLVKDEFNAVVNLPFEKKMSAVRQYLTEKNIPLSFFIGRGDNKLYIDFAGSAKVSLMLFIEELEKDGFLLIEENVQHTAGNQLVSNAKGKFYHELVIPFKNEAKLADKGVVAIKDLENWAKSERSFSPGSDWLYLKIYCGVSKAENLLLNELPSLVLQLRDKVLVDTWFFIRYTDPEHHLRLRFKVTSPAAGAEVLYLLQAALQESIEGKSIDRVLVDTYVRELERYGGLAKIDRAEKIFCLDSELVLSLLNLMEAENVKDNSWLFAVAVVDRYIDSFELNDQQKYKFILNCRDWLAKEFHANKTQRRKISTKYREDKDRIEQALDNSLPLLTTNPIVLSLLDEFSKALGELTTVYRTADNDNVGMHLRSFIHMFLLRFCNVKNRSQEYVIYSFLEIHYKSALARHKISVYND